MAHWYANLKIVTPKGTLNQRSHIDREVKDFAAYMHLFHTDATRIEWTPVKEKGSDEATGPKRVVEYNADGTVKSRTPDIDEAQTGGGDWKPEETPATEAKAAPAAQPAAK